jgi:hypothetical protein
MATNSFYIKINDNGSIAVTANTVENNPYLNGSVNNINTSNYIPYINRLNGRELSALQDTIQTTLNNATISNSNTINDITNNAIKSYLEQNNKLYQDIQDSNINAKVADLNPISGALLDNVQQAQNAVPYNLNSNSFDISNNVELTRQGELAANQRLLNPKANKQLGSIENRTGSLENIISGTDLSVFFLAEIPKASDIGTRADLQDKELILIELDSVMQMSYSILREIFPVRALGISKPKSFTRGPIAINGFLSFSIFTDDVLSRLRTQLSTTIDDFSKKSVQLLNNIKRQQEANISPQLSNLDSKIKSIQEQKESAMSSGNSTETDNQIVELNKQLNDLQTQRSILLQSKTTDSGNNLTELIKTYNLYKQTLNGSDIYLLNQLMPFHLLVMGTNEHGTFSKMMIKGVRIIDENQMQGVQQPNIVNRITFAAEDIYPLVSNSTSVLGASSSTDQNNLSANKYSIYTGSQLMKSIATMADTTVVK